MATSPEPTRPADVIAARLAVLTVALTLALGACATPTTPSDTPSAAAPATETTVPAAPPPTSHPHQLADSLAAAEQTLRDPASSEPTLRDAARHQQTAYRALAWHPEWDTLARPRIPAWLGDSYDRNIHAQRQLTALTEPKDTLPAWRIDAPAPADELLGYYRAAQAASGVDWNYLAAINLIETRFGRIHGMSDAGAQGPMQFMPATFAQYGDGGDIGSTRDSIMAAGRYLAANGFADNPEHAIFRYNNSDLYVDAVTDYAAVLAADPAAFTGYYRWDVYYRTTSGDVLLPIGYVETSRIPAADYVATHPQ